jgi:cold shock CspA family protein
MAGPEMLVGQTVKGWLKRFTDGWGFMNSDAFAGDLFVHARENPEIAKYPPKTEFYFVVSLDSKGKPMATNSAPANPTAPKVEEQSTLETGVRMIGTMKSFTEHWGFVRTDDGKDYFFNERSIETYGGEKPIVGSRISFSTAPDNQKPDKMMAVCLQTITPGTGVYEGNNESRKRSAAAAGMDMALMPAMGVGTPVNVPGLTGLPQTIEQLEAVLCTLPSARLFQLAEMKMRMEMTTVPGTMGGLMA